MPFINRVDNGSTTDATSYNASVTGLVGGGRLWVTIGSGGASAPAPTPTLTMTGASFVLVETMTGLSTNSQFSVFYSNTYNAGSSTLNIDFGAVTQTAVAWAVAEQSNPGSGAAVLASSQELKAAAALHVVDFPSGPGEQFIAALSLTGTTHSVQDSPSRGMVGYEKLSERSLTGPGTTLGTLWNPIVGDSTIDVVGTVSTAFIMVAANVGRPNGLVHRADDEDIAAGTVHNGVIPWLQGGGVLWVSWFATAGTLPASPPTITMAGATFTAARVELYGTTGRFGIYYSQDYDPGTIDLGITFTSPSSLSQFFWTAEEQLPGLASGSPVVQSNYAASTTSPIATTLAAGSGSMLCLLATNIALSAGAFTPNSGSKLAVRMDSGPTAGLGAWTGAVNTAPSTTISSGTSFGLIALEAVLPPPPSLQVSRVGLEVPDAPVGLPYDVVVGGAKKAVASDSVIVGGVKKDVVNRWVVVGGVKEPLP